MLLTVAHEDALLTFPIQLLSQLFWNMCKSDTSENYEMCDTSFGSTPCFFRNQILNTESC